MHMQSQTGGLVFAFLLALGASPAGAFEPGTSLKGLGALDSGALVSGSAGNAAGIIEYCVRNNYLSGDAAESVKAGLLGKLGQEKAPADDPGFASGAKGLLQTGDGKSVDLAQFGDMKKSLTRKACDSVLEHAKSLL